MGTGIVKWFRKQKSRMFRKGHVLYFCHIPKTCGTSFDRMIRPRFTDELAAPIAENHAYFTNPELNLEKYDLISGHLFFGYHIPQLVTRAIRSVTLLRDPRSLLLSMFKHGMQFHQDPVHQYIKTNCPTPDLFFKDPVMGAYVANPMARFLGISERSLSPVFIKHARKQPLDTAKALFSNIPTPDVPPSVVLKTALERLSEFHVVGLSEDLQMSLNLVARLEGWPLFGEVPHLNESANKLKVKDLSTETIRAIDKLTELDREVYRVGREMFNQLVARKRLGNVSTVRLHQSPAGSLRKAA